MIISDGQYRFRFIEPDEHEFLFRCFRDWPRDAHGRFTAKRAMDLVDQGCRSNDAVHAPAGLASNFRVTFVIELRDGRGGPWEPIGVTQGRVVLDKCHVVYMTLLPDRRGGHLRRLALLWGHTTYEVFRLSSVEFITPRGNAAIESLFARFRGREAPPEELYNKPLDTDREKRKWRRDLAHRTENIADLYVDDQGKALAYTVDLEGAK